VDRDTSKPLNVEEAKARLRVAAAQASPSVWIRHHPLHAMGIALFVGLVTGHLQSTSGNSLLPALKLLSPLFVDKLRRK